jgi:AcrR family transcriptional regulator
MAKAAKSVAVVDSGASPRERLLLAAKQLFAVRGFEHTSTAAIAQSAKTSESQLIKHFGSKEGLLEAIFDDGWRQMSYISKALAVMSSPREKLRMLLELMLNAFESDQALKELMLLEGRRLRKDDATIVVTPGYLQFVAMLDAILESIQRQGALRPGISVEGLRSALIGMLEGMLRDQVLGRRVGYPAQFGSDEMRFAFNILLEGCLHPDASNR